MTKTETRLQELKHRITGASYNVAYRFSGDQEDVEQDMILAILARYADEPSFLNQTDAYIVNYGAWKATDALRRNLRLTNLDTDYEDETGWMSEDLQDDPWDFIDFQGEVGAVVDSLPHQDQMICHGLAAGFKPRDMAADVGLSYRKIYNRINELQPAFDEFR